MDDLDDAEEANEEDLLELNDDFANVKLLVSHIKDILNNFMQNEVDGNQYIYYCAK